QTMCSIIRISRSPADRSLRHVARGCSWPREPLWSTSTKGHHLARDASSNAFLQGVVPTTTGTGVRANAARTSHFLVMLEIDTCFGWNVPSVLTPPILMQMLRDSDRAARLPEVRAVVFFCLHGSLVCRLVISELSSLHDKA